MLNIINLNYQYDKKPLLRDLNLTLADQEVLCLLGESGSGKSTLLRIIAGLEKPDSGDLLWNGAKINNVAPHKRNFGLMFQDYALFPNRTVAENIAFGLEMKKGTNRAAINDRVNNLLAQIGMTSFRDRRVTELSGGEQQRVALARAIAPAPNLLMLDEPLGALDHNLRQGLLAELRDLLGKNGISAIYVTHDQEEAYSIADRIALLRDGRIIQSDTPETVYRAPVSVWAARFLGHQNICPATAIAARKVRLDFGAKSCIVAVNLDHDLILNQKVNILFQELELGAADDNGESGTWNESFADDVVDLDRHGEFFHNRYRLEGVVRNVIFKGYAYEILFEISPDVRFMLLSKRPLKIGSRAVVPYSPDNLTVLFT